MNKKDITKILRFISLIPGIKGFVSQNFSKKAFILKKDEWHKSIQVLDSENQVNIKIAILINDDIKGELISKEIFSTVKNVLKEQNIKLSNLTVYIRGC